MDDLLKLFRYNRWANETLLDALAAVSPDELREDRGSSFPSLLATAIHLFGAERIWLDRWKGTSPDGFPDTTDVTTVSALRVLWEALWADQHEYLATLDGPDADGSIRYKNFSGTANEQQLAELLRHVVNHGTYHRGQLATMLRQAGHAPPSTDYIRYLREVEP